MKTMQDLFLKIENDLKKSEKYNLNDLIPEFKKHNINFVRTEENIFNSFDNEYFFEYKSFEFSVFISIDYEAYINTNKLYNKNKVDEFKSISSLNTKEFCEMVYHLLSSVLN